MGVENVLIMVYIWHHNMPGSHSKEIFRNVLERSKDLLTTLQQKLLETEQQLVAK